MTSSEGLPMHIFFRRSHLNRILLGVSFVFSVLFFFSGLVSAAASFRNDETASSSDPQLDSGEDVSSDSTQVSKSRKGIDTPAVDESGIVIYQNPAEKSPSEMTEEDFYHTMTPAEKVLLTNHPVTAPELTEAAVMISRIGRPEFAKLLAGKAMEAEGEPEGFAGIVERLGEDKLLSFAAAEGLQDVTRPLVERVMAESKKFWQDPKQIESAFRQTENPSPEIRTNGILFLKRGYPVSLDFLLEKLDAESESDRDQAEAVLAQGGIFAAEAVLARIRTCDEKTLQKLAAVLARNPALPEITPLAVRYYSGDLSPEAKGALEKAILSHVSSIPARKDEAQRAFQRGLAYYEKKIVLPNVAGGEYPIWRVQKEGEGPEQVFLPISDALRFLAAETLYDAWQLDPESSEITSAALTANAEEIVYQNGLDAPIETSSFTERFPNLTTAQLADALDTALKTKHEKGGIIPAVLLGESGDSSLCIGNDGPSVLVQASVCRDRRLRFAAVKAVVQLSPSEPYQGSSGVTSSLIWFTTSLGKRSAIAASADLTEIGHIGNYISDGGVTTLPAGTGRDILTQAQNNADIEFVVALSYIDAPDLRTVAQGLAADFRTADIPMMIVSEDETRTEQARRYGEGEPNVLVSILPFDQESGKRLVHELYRKTEPCQVPAEIRLKQAKEAILLLCRIRQSGGKVYNIEDLDSLVVRFLETPCFLDEGIAFAMTVPSKAVQVILSQLTFDHRFSLDVREKYLAGLQQHIEQYGLLLRGPDILRLFSGPWPGDSGEIRKKFFRLLTQHSEEKTEMALGIRSPHIQNLLGDLVGDSKADIQERRESLDLFRRHLAKFGILLDRADLKRLYDRYNATEDETRLNQELTGALLDIIEAEQTGLSEKNK